MRKRIYIAVICVGLMLAGCAAEEPQPPEVGEPETGGTEHAATLIRTGGAQRNERGPTPVYAGVDNLREDFIASGGACAEWDQENHEDVSLQTGVCNETTVLMVFGAAEDTEEGVDTLQSEGAHLLVGKNWLVGAESATTLQYVQSHGLGGRYHAGAAPSQGSGPSAPAYVVPDVWADRTDSSLHDVAIFHPNATNGVVLTLTVKRTPAARADLDVELGEVLSEEHSYEHLEVTYAPATTADGHVSSAGLSYSYTSVDTGVTHGAMFLFDGWVVEILGASSSSAADVLSAEVEDGTVRDFLENLHLDDL